MAFAISLNRVRVRKDSESPTQRSTIFTNFNITTQTSSIFKLLYFAFNVFILELKNERPEKTAFVVIVNSAILLVMKMCIKYKLGTDRVWKLNI